MERASLRTLLAGSFLALCATSAAYAASSAHETNREAECTAAGESIAAQDDWSHKATALAAHNAERARLRLPPLEWSCRLEQQAESWAEALVARGRLEHASAEARAGSGENLWMGTSGRFPVEHMVGRFIDEKRHYRHNRFPDISQTGNWADAAHYTQVVWRETREVGCAVAQGEASDVLVCRYFPAGNVRGKLAF